MSKNAKWKCHFGHMEVSFPIQVVERNVGYYGACIELGEANSSVCECSDFQTSFKLRYIRPDNKLYFSEKKLSNL